MVAGGSLFNGMGVSLLFLHVAVVTFDGFNDGERVRCVFCRLSQVCCLKLNVGLDARREQWHQDCDYRRGGQHDQSKSPG